MSHVESAAENGGFAEEEVFVGCVDLPFDIVKAFEPYDFDLSCAVDESGGHTAFGALPDDFFGDETAEDLDIVHVGGEFADLVDAAAVDIAVGEVFEDVFFGADVGLVGEDFRAFGAYALDVL